MGLGLGGARISTGKDSKQDYATPVELMLAIRKRFGPISFDLAAHNHNRKNNNYFAPCTSAEGPMPFDAKAYGMDAFDHPWAELSTVKRSFAGQHRSIEIWNWKKDITIQQWTRPLLETPLPGKERR